MSIVTATEWWARADIDYHGDRLVFAGRSVESLARQFGTPSFFYHGPRAIENISRLRDALERVGFQDRFQIHYAMKANRFAPLVSYLRGSGLVGIDACSPNEVEQAISCGFRAHEISFTAGSLSRRDLARLTEIDELRINCDSLTSIERWGRLGPGRRIGIRVNPGMGIGRALNDKLQYSGTGETTKFGVYREQFYDALRLARQYDLEIDTIHFHTGCGYLTPQLDQWDAIIDHANWFVEQVPTLRAVNVGGGLGVPHVAVDQPLDLDRWAEILAKHFLGSGLMVEVEPGDYIVKDCGVLLLAVSLIEQKQQTTFVGLDAGFNVAVEPAVYGLPFQPAPAVRREGPEQRVTLHGNINEALDIWYRDWMASPLREDDIVALLNAGAYSSSMASEHCMRGEFKEFLLL